MLCIVVVPGDVIKIQEREHFVAIFLQAFDDLARCFALAESIRKTMVEAIDENPVFPPLPVRRGREQRRVGGIISTPSPLG